MKKFNSFFCCGSADAVIVPSSNEEVPIYQQFVVSFISALVTNTKNTSAIKIQSLLSK